MNAFAFERFAVKCYQMPQTIEGIQKSGIAAAAQVTKTTILKSASAHGWPTQRHVSSTGKTKGYVAVHYDLSPFAALVQGRAFAAMFEKGAKPHVEPKRAGHLISIPSQGVFAHVSHPGFKGRGFWDEGIAAAMPLIGKEFETGLETGIRKVFR